MEGIYLLLSQYRMNKGKEKQLARTPNIQHKRQMQKLESIRLTYFQLQRMLLPIIFVCLLFKYSFITSITLAAKFILSLIQIQITNTSTPNIAKIIPPIFAAKGFILWSVQYYSSLAKRKPPNPKPTNTATIIATSPHIKQIPHYFIKIKKRNLEK